MQRASIAVVSLVFSSLTCSSGESEVVRVIRGGAASIGENPGTGGSTGANGGSTGNNGGSGGGSASNGGSTGANGGSTGSNGGAGGGMASNGGGSGRDAGMMMGNNGGAGGSQMMMGSPDGPPANDGPFKVLVFTKTAGFKHSSIPDGVKMLQDLAPANNYEVTVTDNAAMINDAFLDPFTVLFFMNTTDDILNAEQQAAVERFIKKGRGFAGVHAATDTEDSGGWPWYGELVGSFYTVHGPANEQGALKLEPGASTHPATKHLPQIWNRTDEWYRFRRDVTGLTGVQVLLRASNDNRPMAWTREYDNGRAFYTALGHTNASYTEPNFRQHVLGGLLWAAGRAK